MFKRFLLVLLSLTLLMPGCQYVNPIGPIFSLGVMWVQGEAAEYFNTEQAVIHRALLETLKELQIPLVKEETKDGVIYVRAGDDDRFKIKIIAVKPQITKLCIRINIMGDKPYAELIYHHVKQKPGVKKFATVEALNTALEKR